MRKQEETLKLVEDTGVIRTQTDRQTQRETQTDRQRDTQRDTQTQRETQTDRQTEPFWGLQLLLRRWKQHK